MKMYVLLWLVDVDHFFRLVYVELLSRFVDMNLLMWCIDMGSTLWVVDVNLFSGIIDMDSILWVVDVNLFSSIIDMDSTFRIIKLDFILWTPNLNPRVQPDVLRLPRTIRISLLLARNPILGSPLEPLVTSVSPSHASPLFEIVLIGPGCPVSWH